MTCVILHEGSRYYDPHSECHFTITDAPEAGSEGHATVGVLYDGEEWEGGLGYDEFGMGSDYTLVEEAR